MSPARVVDQASPWRRRGRTGRGPGPACRRRGTRSRRHRGRRACARAPARPASARGRSRRRWRRACAASTAKRAGAAAGVQHARPRRSSGSQSSSVRAHPVAAGADRGADAADRRVGGQPRPGLGRGAVEIGLELPAALAGRRAVCHQSNPSRSKMSRSFIGLPISGSAAGPQGGGQPQVLGLHRFQLGRGLHLEQRRLLQAAAADHVEVGEVGHGLQARRRR